LSELLRCDILIYAEVVESFAIGQTRGAPLEPEALRIVGLGTVRQDQRMSKGGQVSMAKWSKGKDETILPPLTTEKDHATNWHKSTTRPTREAPALWVVTWDTRRRSDAFNTSYQTSAIEAVDCARKFLKLGFVVYSIKEPDGTEFMDEAALAERFNPETSDTKITRPLRRPIE
jgi:hypothetical protein